MKIAKVVSICLLVLALIGCAPPLPKADPQGGTASLALSREILGRGHHEFNDTDGLFVTYWEASYEFGNAAMDIFDGGYSLEIEYDGVFDPWPCIVAGKGVKPCWGETISWVTVLDNNTNSLGVYGWLRDPLVEYYIGRIDGPPNPVIEYDTDQGHYKLRIVEKNQQNIVTPESASPFLQFNIEGPKTSPINMAQHYAAWEKELKNWTPSDGWDWHPIVLPDYCVVATEIFEPRNGSSKVVDIMLEDNMTLSPVSQTTSYLGTGGGAPLTIDVRSTKPWSISSASIPSWLTISPASGNEGDTTVTIQVAANNGLSDRGADLSFYYSGTDKWKGAQIIQTARPGASNTRAWVYARDESIDANDRGLPGLYVKNIGGSTLRDFRVQYYFTAENGKAPVMEDNHTPFSAPELKRISGSNNGNEWSIVLDFAGSALASGSSLPTADFEKFLVRYADLGNFDKSNDWSRPMSGGEAYPDFKIVVYDRTGRVIGGNPPANIPASNYFLNQYSGKMLTVSDNSDYSDVLCRGANKGWTSQDWISERAGNNDNIVRLKNVWSGKYLTAVSTSDYAEVKCQPLGQGWTSQNWIVENGPGNSRRLKNEWSGKYLTATSANEGAVVRLQNLNTGWNSQQWNIK